MDHRDRLLMVGIDAEERERSATFVQEGDRVVSCGVKQEGVLLMPVRDVVEGKYGEYLWRALEMDEEFKDFSNGYFIRSLPGSKPVFPVQACLYIAEESSVQHVHNIVVAEEMSELHVITGCTSGTRRGTHIGVSEFYVKRGATLHFTMIHAWGDEVETYPKTAVVVEEGGTFISDYICMHPGKAIKMYPTVYLNGERATARFQSVLVAVPGSSMDIGSRVYLRGEKTRAEIISRAVSVGGKIIARGHLVGEMPGVKAHLGCRGLLLDPKGRIHAIPELEGKAIDLEMTHEAAVGKIDREEVEYLMARGMTEDDAVSAIVRGFLNVEIMGLPEPLKRELDEIISKSNEDAL
jgi:Fe-S cluster assembly scaffold protein SufB